MDLSQKSMAWYSSLAGLVVIILRLVVIIPRLAVILDVSWGMVTHMSVLKIFAWNSVSVHHNIKACIVKDILHSWCEKPLDIQYIMIIHGTRGKVSGKRKEAKILCLMFMSQLSATCKDSDIFFFASTCASLSPLPHSYTIVLNMATVVWFPSVTL